MLNEFIWLGHVEGKNERNSLAFENSCLRQCELVSLNEKLINRFTRTIRVFAVDV